MNQKTCDGAMFPADLVRPATSHLITGRHFRPDAVFQPGPASYCTLEYRVYLSTSDRTAHTLSTVFADNLGPDNAK
jgi:hypothetical protein